MTPAEVAERFGAKQSGDGWSARCPAHEDRSPSLSISAGRDGGTVLNCHAGCPTADVVAAVGLQMLDLAPQRTEPRSAEVIARYPFHDAEGTLLYTVVRRAGKRFHQEPANGKRGAGAMAGVPRVLYRLPAVLAAVEAGAAVFITEGEKDADALTAAGVCATTAAQGAGKWHTVAAHAAEVLTGAQVIVVADRDEPGYRHAAEIERSLRDVAAEVIVVEAVDGKDAADHLSAGFTVEQFAKILDRNPPGDAAPILDLETLVGIAPATQDDDIEDGDDFDLDESWLPVDLGAILAGDVAQPMPTLLQRRQGGHLLYPGAVNGLHGDSGAGKGWVVCFAVEQELRAGRCVMLLDFEDTAASIVARLRNVGCSDDAIRSLVLYMRPQVPIGNRAVAYLCDLCRDRSVSLVVIDSVGEAFALEGIDENKDTEVGPWYRRVPRPLAEAGPAVLLIDHSTKANDNPLHPSGSKRKRAAITGASYFAEAVKPFVKGQGGRLTLKCAKDRHGNYRKGEQVASLVMAPSLTSAVRMELHAPDEAGRAIVDFAAVRAARDAVAKAKSEGRPLSKAALRGLITGSTDNRNAGIDLAISRGALSVTAGPRNAQLVEYVSDLPEGDS